MSTIEWTEETWNPVTGCSKVSEGCRNCYAEKMSLRFGWSKKPWTAQNASENVILHPERLSKPMKAKKPTMYFVNSMSDLFHDMVPDDYITKVFDVMANTPQNTYQVLTKRPERMMQFVNNYNSENLAPYPLPNVWLGTSVEDNRVLSRIDYLRETDASVRFLSCEPLLGSLQGINLRGIHWVISGAESGQRARKMNEDWVRELRDECVAKGTKFFYKQKLVNGAKVGLPELDGKVWSEMPA